MKIVKLVNIPVGRNARALIGVSPDAMLFGAARSSKPAHIFGLWVACFCFNIVWR